MGIMRATAMLYRLGKLTVKYRWPILIVWVACLVAAAPFATRVASQLKAGFGSIGAESDRALEVGRQELGGAGASVTLVFRSDALTVQDPRYQAAMSETLAPLVQMPQVARVAMPRNVAPEARTTYATLLLTAEPDESLDLYDEIEARIQPHGDLRVWLTGGVPIFAEVVRQSEKDLRRAEIITIPVVLVALLLVFGGLLAAGIPTLMGAVSVAAALAAIYGLTRATDISIFALNIVSFLGLGAAIDYSLLVVSRFREELESHDKEEAIARTLSTAGRAILFSGATSFLGLSGLLLFKFMMLRSIGLGGMLVIGISMLVALTLLPALLALVGEKVNALSLLPRRRGNGRMWRRLATAVMKYPVAVGVPLIAVLVLLGGPLMRINVGEPWASLLPPGTQAREGWNVADRELGPGELSPLFIVVQAPRGPLDSESVGALYDLTRQIAKDPRVDRVESIVDLDPRVTREQYQLLYANPMRWPPEVQQAMKTSTSPRVTSIQVYSKYGPVSEETKGLVRAIRAMKPGAGLELLVDGAPADLMDSISAMYRDFPKVILFVVLTIYLALLVLFRSVVLPLKAVLMNTLSIIASYGALVFIFQEGHFQRLLGFQAEGYIEPTIPILMFCILYGLSMDYEVFLLSRVKEIHDRTKDNVRSVAEGLERTGGIITSAALILVLVAASFSTAQVVLVKALGVGIAIAVLLDATLVRALLVPALMRVLGEWNWWAPRFLRRILPA